jgi:antitoxin FitA
MVSMVVRNIPDEVMKAIKARAKANERNVEAEVRAILTAAAAESESKHRKAGEELVALGRLVGGVELDIRREPMSPK